MVEVCVRILGEMLQANTNLAWPLRSSNKFCNVPIARDFAVWDLLYRIAHR